MKEINVFELKELFDSNADIQLIDVREPYEYDIANLNGELIPLATLLENYEKISRDKRVILHCRSGMRSASAIHALEQTYGFGNLYNLTGGILTYADKIDSSLIKY